MAALCDKESSYLNEIQEEVRGSKTSTLEILRSLEYDLKIITSAWKIENFKGSGSPKQRAVKAYKLSEDKQKLIRYYEPLFRTIE